MENELEKGFVTLLEAALDLEDYGYRSREESIEAENKVYERLGELYKLAKVPYDSRSPGPEITKSPLLTWLWNRLASEEVSYG